MAIVTGDRYLEKLVKFVDDHAGALIDGSLVLKLNPAGLHYVQSRLEALAELENLLAGAPIDYLRAYVSDLGDHRALEQLRRILRLLTSLKVVSVLPPPSRDPTPLSLRPFGRLRVLELRGCDLSTSAAKGLLELRHTLEKIICHNSTDALRHVFASRIAEIRFSPQWNRLSFVSCACNRLVLMDESLQLLPAVETLDLSRNKFAKVDNLRKCTKLKYLDLGFNNLRTIAPFSEVSCQIIKLVLRNNSLTALHGIENLKSLEGLDVSYNVISNFSELEFLAGLPFLRNLWLEGNPLCSARWYRAHVFGYFAQPDKLKLDDKEISAGDFWKRKIIIASRLKRPASYGFYSPAKDGCEGDGSMNRKRRKVTRLALIESEEESTCFSSDQESPSCDNEIQSKEENAISDDEAEIVDLINRVEFMKKERSILWLREFKEWMDHESENFGDGSKYGALMYQCVKEDHLKDNASLKHKGESSRYALDSLQTSGDETGTNVIDAYNSLADLCSGAHGGFALPGMGKVDMGQKYQKSNLAEEYNGASLQVKSSNPDSFTAQKGQRIVENGSILALTSVDDTTESLSSSAYPGSPPHYQQDILDRRHNLVEEILQLSAKSFSVVSSDSDTSPSEDDLCDIEHSEYIYQSKNNEHLYASVGWHSSLNDCKDNNDDEGHGICWVRDNKEFLINSCAKQVSNDVQILNSNSNDFAAVFHDGEMAHSVNQEVDRLNSSKSKRKLRRRVVSLSENMVSRKGTLEKLNANKDTHGVGVEHGERKLIVGGSDFHEVIEKNLLTNDTVAAPTIAHLGELSDESIEKYFYSNIADSRNNETCRHYMRCECVLEPESLHREREVALLLSSENKLYVLLIGVTFDRSGSILSLLAWHRVEDVGEISVGIGLQFVRVYIERGATYLFLTRSIEKSRQLLYTFQVFDPCSTNCKFLLRSLEQVQVQLFEEQICGGSKLSIFQYSMVLFQENNNEEKLWVSRSLFVSGGCVFVCVEDLSQFGSLSADASSPPYFSLDSCCSVSDIFELVIEWRDSLCVTLVLERATSKFCHSSKTQKVAATVDKGNTIPGSLMWKLKWFSVESLVNFVALLKAIHAGVTMSPLLITYVS